MLIYEIICIAYPLDVCYTNKMEMIIMINQQMLALGQNRSVIRELFEYGKKKIAECGADNVFDYSLGNPSVPAPDCVNTAIKTILDTTPCVTVHGYTSAVGDLDTRQAIANDLNARFSTKYSADNLFLTCGAAASLVSVFKALIAYNKSEIIAIAPYFPEYKCFAEANGAVFRTISPDTEGFQINFEELDKAINTNTQAVIINSPNNPSGSVYSEETIQRLAALLTAKSKAVGHPIYIISDEPYRELVYDNFKLPFIPKYYPSTIVCYSYSKSLSLPGERIGYVLVPPTCKAASSVYAAALGAARASGYVCAPSLMQEVVKRCVSARPDLETYQKNRDLLWSSLSEMGYNCVKPSGAFYLFFEAPNGDAEAFSEKAKEYNLLLVPGTGFGCPGWLRAAYCVDYAMIERSLPAFKSVYDFFAEQ